MTREEARNIVFERCKWLEGSQCKELIDALEALRLIKFDDYKVWYQSENDNVWGLIQVVEFKSELSFWVAGKLRICIPKDRI